MKDASPETAAILAEAEALAKGITLDPAPKENTTMITDEVRAALPDEVRKELERLESVEKSAASAPAADETLTQAAFEKSLEGMHPTVAAQFRKDRQDLQRANAMTKALIDEREDARYEEMAKSLVYLPGVDASFGSVLRKAADSLDDASFATLEKALSASAAAIKESELYKEIGTGHGGTDDGTALGTIEAHATELQKADPTMTKAEAMVKAAELHPDLYAQHRKES